MRIAITYEEKNGEVFQHFGHTERFKIYDVTDGEIVTATTVNTRGSGHGALADILKKLCVDTLICGGIGDGAKRALAGAGITLYGGVSGNADKAAESFLAGTLSYNSNVKCEHHGENHNGHDDCGNNGCGHAH